MFSFLSNLKTVKSLVINFKLAQKDITDSDEEIRNEIFGADSTDASFIERLFQVLIINKKLEISFSDIEGTITLEYKYLVKALIGPFLFFQIICQTINHLQ